VPLIYTGDEAGNTKQLDLSNKLYEDLNTLRRNHPALRYGSYWNAQNSASYHLFSFIRSSGDDSVLIVVNFVNEKIEANIQMPAGASQLWKNQFSGINLKVKDERLSVAISPLGFLALVPYSEKEIL
jgi:glycosidase